MKDYVKCLECGTENSREVIFLDLQLAVRPFGATTAYRSVVREPSHITYSGVARKGGGNFMLVMIQSSHRFGLVASPPNLSESSLTGGL